MAHDQSLVHNQHGVILFPLVAHGLVPLDRPVVRDQSSMVRTYREKFVDVIREQLSQRSRS